MTDRAESNRPETAKLMEQCQDLFTTLADMWSEAKAINKGDKLTLGVDEISLKVRDLIYEIHIWNYERDDEESAK